MYIANLSWLLAAFDMVFDAYLQISGKEIAFIPITEKLDVSA